MFKPVSNPPSTKGSSPSLLCTEEAFDDDFPDDETDNENQTQIFQYSEDEFDLVLDWLESHREFLIASFDETFKDWVKKNLTASETEILTNFSDEFKNFMDHANHPRATQDDIECGAYVDIIACFISSVRNNETISYDVLVNNEEQTKQHIEEEKDLDLFLKENPKLVIFFREELRSLEPIAEKWKKLTAPEKSKPTNLPNPMKSFLSSHKKTSAFAEEKENLPNSPTKRKREGKRTDQEVDPELPQSPTKTRSLTAK